MESESVMYFALENINRILMQWPSKAYPDIHKIGKSLEQLTTKIESIVDAEADALKEQESQQTDERVQLKDELVGAWYESYDEIEQVLCSMLEFFGITLNLRLDDGTGHSFHQQVLEYFDIDGSPLKQVLGHRNGSPPVAEELWSDTWREILAGETPTTGRNLTRDSIDQLRLFKEWWPTSVELANPAPELNGATIAPPMNYQIWYDGILKGLVSGFQVCHLARKYDKLSAAKLEAWNAEDKAASSSTNRRGSTKRRSNRRGNRRAVDPEISSLRQEVATLRRELKDMTKERDHTRNDRKRFRLERDGARKDLVEVRKEHSAHTIKQEKQMAEDLENRTEQVWGQVRAGLASDRLFEYIRSMSRGGA